MFPHYAPYPRPGRSATLVVAASNASDRSRRDADYVCTGTNDHATIQQALDALPNNQGKVALTEGQFNINGTIYVDSDVTLAGAGPSTKLRLVDTAAVDTIFNDMNDVEFKAVVTNRNHTGARDSNIVLRDFSLDGNSAGQGINQAMAGVCIHNAEHVEVVGVSVRDFLPGSFATHSKRSFCLLTSDVDHVTVRGGWYEIAGYEPVGIRSASKRVSMVGVHVGDGDRHSVQVNSTWPFGGAADPMAEHITIQGCVIETGTVAGAAIIDHGGRKVAIVGNVITTTGGIGIILQGSESTVTGNMILATGGQAIRIRAQGAQFVISGNHLVSSSEPAITTYDSVNDPPSHIAITGNTLSAPTNRICLYLASRGAVVTGNQIVQGLRGIQVEGTATRDILITGNKISGMAGGGNVGIRTRSGSSYIQIRDNLVYGGAATGISLEDDTDVITVEGNDLQGTTTKLSTGTSGTNLRIRNNRGTATEANGTATVADGATTAVVTHGLNRTPALKDISVTPTNSLGNAAKFWISTVTATEFTVNVNADPGATTATFVWTAQIL